MSADEKKIAWISFIVFLIVLYFLNKKYLYIIDVAFSGEDAENLTLKTGFIYPVKTSITLGEPAKRIKFYGYVMESRKTDKGYDLYLNNKKVYTIFKDSYYMETKGVPTGRIYL